MLLNILVPVYNVKAYLPAFLATLAASLTEETELILLNDAATDGSAEIVRQWLLDYPYLNARLLDLSDNQGLTRARHTLLSHSRAEYIWYLDPDDEIRADALASVCAALRQHQPDVLLFDYDVFYDESGQIKHREQLRLAPSGRREDNHHHHLYELAIYDGKHYFWNKVFRRSQISGLVAFTIPAFEDIAYTPVWLYHCRHYFYLRQTLLRYRIRATSIVQSISIKQIYGLQAYLEQALFCAQHLGRNKTYWHLLYKASAHYCRLSKKLARSEPATAAPIQAALNQIYAGIPVSGWPLVGKMLRAGMVGKALRLSSLMLLP